MTTANTTLPGTTNRTPAANIAGNSTSRDRMPVSNKNSGNDTYQLPALVELAYTASALMVIIVTLIVGIISLVAKASLVDLVIRTSVAILLTGGISMLVSWQVSQGALKASIAEMEEEEKKLELERAKKLEEAQKNIPEETVEEFDEFSNESVIEER